jgi:bacillithiol biosynthesis deacetylase BshB1
MVDLLAFGAHPDDVELAAGGTVIKHVVAGKTAAIVDLTRGELGTRGSPEIRLQEAGKAAEILGVLARENLDLGDGFFTNDKSSQIRVIEMVRKYRPQVVLAPARSDRHPDHGRAAALVETACFLSGLVKVETRWNGSMQDAWRPRAVYHYMQGYYIAPSVVVDVTDVWERKVEAILAFRSQFHDPNSKEPETILTRPEFIEFIRARAMECGWHVGVKYAEAFETAREIGVRNLFDLI